MALPPCFSHIPWMRVLVSLSIFAFGFLLDDFMTGVSLYRARHLLQNSASNPPLPDIGFDLLPTSERLCAHSEIETYFLISVMLYTLFRRMLFYPNGWLVFCRFAVSDGVLMILRATTVAVTSLNNPWPACNQCGLPDGCPNSLWDAVTYTMARFPLYDCGDLIFSGHTAHFLMMGFIWSTYRSSSSSFSSSMSSLCATVERGVVWAAVLGGLSLLLSCRFHYSIDILVAFYLSVCVWLAWSYLLNVDCGLYSKPVRWFHEPSLDRGGAINSSGGAQNSIKALL
jgi:hypothetical protein